MEDVAEVLQKVYGKQTAEKTVETPVVEKPTEKPVEKTEGKPAESPKAEEKPATTPQADGGKPADKPQEPSWEEKFKSITGGEFEKAEDLFSKYKETQSLIDARIQEKEKEYSNHILPHSDLIRKANEVLKSGGDLRLFVAVNSLDIDSLSEQDAIKLRLQYEKKLTPEEADRKVNRKYLLSQKEDAIKADETLTDSERSRKLEEIADAKTDLGIDGREAKEALKALKVSIEPKPQATKEDFEKAENQRVEAWKPVISTSVKEVKMGHTFKIDGEDVTIDIPLDEKIRGQIEENIQKAIANPAFQLTGTKEDKEFIDTLTSDYAREILFANAVETAYKAGRDATVKKVVNPSSEKEAVSDKTGGKDAYDKFLEAKTAGQI